MLGLRLIHVNKRHPDVIISLAVHQKLCLATGEKIHLLKINYRAAELQINHAFSLFWIRNNILIVSDCHGSVPNIITKSSREYPDISLAIWSFIQHLVPKRTPQLCIPVRGLLTRGFLSHSWRAFLCHDALMGFLNTNHKQTLLLSTSGTSHYRSLQWS